MSGCNTQIPKPDWGEPGLSGSEQRAFYLQLEDYLKSQSNNLIDAAIKRGQSSLDIKIECRYMNLMYQVKEKLIPDYFYELKGLIENMGRSIDNFHWTLEELPNPNHLLIRLRFRP